MGASPAICVQNFGIWTPTNKSKNSNPIQSSSRKCIKPPITNSQLTPTHSINSPHPFTLTSYTPFLASHFHPPTMLSKFLLPLSFILLAAADLHINHHLPPPLLSLTTSKKFEGSSNLINLRYHMGPVLSSPVNINLIWYGHWPIPHQLLIKDFLLSLSSSSSSSTITIPSPSVSEWWKTLSLYTDQTGANISRSILISNEYSNNYSHGKQLTRLSIQSVISSSVRSKPFPVDHKNGIYLILTAADVTMQDFCRAVCGFHYFTFASKVGYTLPYAWVGNSATQCPEVCAYPFAVPGYMGGGGPGEVKPPNGEVGIDGMISVIGHELAEMASNPLVNAWYAGEDPTAPTEIGDLCEGVYGTGGGGGYTGQVMRDGGGKTYNLNGRNGRRFLVQWIWNPVLKACSGPNALD